MKQLNFPELKRPRQGLTTLSILVASTCYTFLLPVGCGGQSPEGGSSKEKCSKGEASACIFTQLLSKPILHHRRSRWWARNPQGVRGGRGRGIELLEEQYLVTRFIIPIRLQSPRYLRPFSTSPCTIASGSQNSSDCEVSWVGINFLSSPRNSLE